ncbi:MAG: methylenetetrahydrofolate reductase [NAD(P)H], partial [Proteobacteria bacterium]
MSENTYSLELFPPKTPEGAQKLRATRAELAQLHPRYFSVTFGAGGSTQSGTRDTVLEISAEGHDAAPHLSCIGRNRDELRTMLREYQSHGIRRVVALRGGCRGTGTRAT